MKDNEIVELYWSRNESAIEHTAAKYGKYCYSISYGILNSAEDADECVNDTYMAAWNAIPPHRPALLSTFLGKITRRLSLKMRRSESAEKRGGTDTVTLALDELLECVPDGKGIDERLNAEELGKSISDFLLTVGTDERRVFILRYWHLKPISEICTQFAFSKSKVETMLHRTRAKLMAHLKKEGIFE